MGFHLRKSFNFGGIRINLSNSGVGFSTGIKGLRVGVDGKGRSYVGGGIGPLRYREQLSSFSTQQEFNKLPYNEVLRSTKIGCLFQFLLWFFIFPVFLFFCTVFIIALCQNHPLLLLILFIGEIIAAIKFLINFFNPKFYVLYKKGIEKYNIEDYSSALDLFVEAKNKELQAKTCKFSFEATTQLNNHIYYCYKNLNKNEECLNFIQSTYIISQRREKIVECFYILEKWQDLINYLQVEYDDKEKQEHPIYYALLGKAFLNNGNKEIALETMLQGPVNKRNMDLEMCSFRYTLGEIYEAVGETQKALKQYQKIYSFDINYEDVAEKISRLSNIKKEV